MSEVNDLAGQERESPRQPVAPAPFVDSGRAPRDWLGSLIGLIVFVFGVGLLVTVFRVAFDLYTTPPKVAMSLKPNQPLDLTAAADGFTGVVVKVIVLVVMAGLGSVIANRGIVLYTRSRGR